MRGIGMPNDLSQKLRSSILAQKTMPYNSASYEKTIDGIYALYPVEKMVAQADIISDIEKEK